MAKKTKVINAVKDDTEVEFEVSSGEAVGNFDEVLENEQNIPLPTDKEWHSYVMSQFTEDELQDKKNPTVDGLRRVAELLVGYIVEQTTDVVQEPTKANEWRATVTHKVVLLCSSMNDTASPYKTFTAAADSYWGNTDKIYSKYPVAIAESRAEARAFRKALKLKVVAADELSKIAEQENPPTPDEFNSNPTDITDVQINFIDLTCKRTNIDVEKFVKTDYAYVKTIRQLKHGQSLTLVAKASAYLQKPPTIPEEIIGYKEGWRGDFCT